MYYDFNTTDKTIRLGANPWAGATKLTNGAELTNKYITTAKAIRPYNNEIINFKNEISSGLTNAKMMFRDFEYLEVMDISNIDFTGFSVGWTEKFIFNCPHLRFIKLGTGDNFGHFIKGPNMAVNKRLIIQGDFSNAIEMGAFIGNLTQTPEVKVITIKPISKAQNLNAMFVDSYEYNSNTDKLTGLSKVNLEEFTFDPKFRANGNIIGFFNKCYNISHVIYPNNIPFIPRYTGYGVRERTIGGYGKERRDTIINMNLDFTIEELKIDNLNYLFYELNSRNIIWINRGTKYKTLTNFAYFYAGCDGLEYVDLDDLDILKYTNIRDFFSGCFNIKYLKMTPKAGGYPSLMNWTTAASFTGPMYIDADFSNYKGNLADFFRFLNVPELYLNIKGFNASINNANSMFYGAKMKRIYVDKNFQFPEGYSATKMFENCTLLEGGAGTKYDPAKIGPEMAVIDTGITQGYLTGLSKQVNLIRSTGLIANLKNLYTKEVFRYSKFESTTPFLMGMLDKDEDLNLLGWYIDGIDSGKAETCFIPYKGKQFVDVLVKFGEPVIRKVNIKVKYIGYGRIDITGDVNLGKEITVKATPSKGNYYLKTVIIKPSGEKITNNEDTFNFQLNEEGTYIFNVYFIDESGGQTPSKPDIQGNPFEDITGNIKNDIITDDTPSAHAMTGNLGLYKIFVPKNDELQRLINLMNDKTFTDTLKSLWNNSLLKMDDLIIGAYVMPKCAKVEPSPKTVSVGWLNTSVSMNYTNENTAVIDLGDIEIPRFWNNFLDFEPYTKIDIYLPFIGNKELNTNDVLGKILNLSYKLDLLTGGCSAIIKVNGSVRYQFTGNCAYKVPLSNNGLDQMAAGAVKMVAGAGLAAVGGLAIAGGLSAGMTVASTGSGVLQAGAEGIKAMNTGSRVDGAQGNENYLMVSTPYITITRNIPDTPNDFAKYNGYKSNLKSNVSKLRGYTEIANIVLDGINATDDEIEELRGILTSGVIL